MSEERNLILNKKIINETVETIIDNYSETNDEFFEDREEYMIEVINELYNRIK